MFKISIKVLQLLVIFSLQYASAAEWVYVRPELGLGFSDNVYQDDFNKRSDAFTWLQTSAKYNLDEATLTGSLNLKMYSKEAANNSVSYSLNHRKETDYKDLDLTLGLGGFSYFKTDVGSTDEAFTHFYLQAYASKLYKVNSDFDVNFEGGIKGSSYPQLANRYDISPFFRMDGAWRLNEDVSINPYFELGFVFSNRGYYSKSYMDLGVEYVQKLDELYKFNLDLYLRNNSYPNRRVSEILLIPNRSGRLTSTNIDSNEAISLSQITATVTRTELNHELSLGISHANETSLSQLEHYKEVQVLASTAWTF